jgi:hypothetical protein
MDIYKGGELRLKTNAIWQKEIVLDSLPVLICPFGDPEAELYDDLKTHISNSLGKELKVFQPQFYYWTRYSYIPWHNDGNFKGAMTIYLDADWKENWGGYFMYKEGDEVKAIKPEKNLAIHQTDGVQHCTTPVTFFGTLRRTIQIFLED